MGPETGALWARSPAHWVSRLLFPSRPTGHAECLSDSGPTQTFACASWTDGARFASTGNSPGRCAESRSAPPAQDSTQRDGKIAVGPAVRDDRRDHLKDDP